MEKRVSGPIFEELMVGFETMANRAPSSVPIEIACIELAHLLADHLGELPAPAAARLMVIGGMLWKRAQDLGDGLGRGHGETVQ